MGRSQETYNKKEVRNKKEKKRKEKEQKRIARKESEKKGSSLDDMMAYVDEHGRITSTPPDPNKKIDIKLEDIEIGVPKRENVKLDPVRKGIITFYNDSKGFGFIRDLETQESVFVHVNNLTEAVIEGNLVSFEIVMGPKGPTAIKVKLAN